MDDAKLSEKRENKYYLRIISEVCKRFPKFFEI